MSALDVVGGVAAFDAVGGVKDREATAGVADFDAAGGVACFEAICGGVEEFAGAGVKYSNSSTSLGAESKYEAASPLGDGVACWEAAALDDPHIDVNVSPSRAVALVLTDVLLSVERAERLTERSNTSGALGVWAPVDRSLCLPPSTRTELRRLSRTDSGERGAYPEWRLSDSGG